jgi:hypothetical protein
MSRAATRRIATSVSDRRAALVLAALLAAGCGGGGASYESPIDYSTCEGFDDIVDLDCDDGGCVTTDAEREAFELWKSFALLRSGLPEADLFQRVDVLDVAEGEFHVRIDYMIDVYGVHYYYYVAFPLDRENGGNWEAYADDFRVRSTWELLVQYDQIAPIEDIAAAMASCHPSLELNWCFPQFISNPVVFVLRDVKEIDPATATCVDGWVNIFTAEVERCEIEPCFEE